MVLASAHHRFHSLPLLNFSLVNGTMVTEELLSYLLEIQSQTWGGSQSLSINQALSFMILLNHEPVCV